MYDIATPAVITFLVGFAVLLVAGVVALAAGTAQLVTTLRSERQVRIARHETIGAHYFGLAGSH
ncbi:MULTISPECIES: hypothetical protein [Nocardioides]|uniref:Uncharacterized protein n=1 Tax=Nocardioides lianchengensis TaxID=1045774 RepID=A0A1G6UKX8_9ACTN|nr:hypothetical protein [Nocardioides lianchengensis]NYG10966.1 hypothetical protein [Nocardioides lianchengensis]SDD41963.1 hypothetical protein SAMN05421872_10816 [Nocardioides lianchengensis]